MSARRSLERTRRWSFQLVVATVAITVFVWRVDAAEALRRAASVDMRWAFLGLLVFTASKVIHGWRWWSFLGRRASVPVSGIVRVFLLSNMANALLPLRAGDVLRVEIPSHRYGVPRPTLIASVFVVETVLDWFAFALLFGAALLLLDLPPAVRPLLVALGVSAALLFAVTEGVVRLPARWALALGGFTRAVPARARAPAARFLRQFSEGLASLRSPRETARLLAVSCVAWAAEVVVYYMLGRAFGLELSAAEALVLMTAANIVVSLPLTPWDVGTYELAVTEALVLLGGARVDAAGFAIGSHLLLHAWVGITGLAAMWSLHLRPRDLLSLPVRGRA